MVDQNILSAIIDRLKKVFSVSKLMLIFIITFKDLSYVTCNTLSHFKCS